MARLTFGPAIKNTFLTLPEEFYQYKYSGDGSEEE